MPCTIEILYFTQGDQPSMLSFSEGHGSTEASVNSSEMIHSEDTFLSRNRFDQYGVSWFPRSFLINVRNDKRIEFLHNISALKGITYVMA